MQDVPEGHMSEYTWMSVGEHIRWLEQVCQLRDFNPTAVFSMKVTVKTGLRGLQSKKTKLLETITENVSSVEEYEQARRLEPQHLAIIAVIKNNMQIAIDIIEEQLSSIGRMLEVNQRQFEYQDLCSPTDEPPF